MINFAARVVSKTHRLSHISPILKSLNWFKIDQRIQYKVLSLPPTKHNITGSTDRLIILIIINVNDDKNRNFT